MQIRSMFQKDIDRPINGVIKVMQTDEENKRQELEEYVITRELRKHFGSFYSHYEQSVGGTTDKMGVWISGFFGSGKSHFLKILSYLLANDVVAGRHAVDYFEEKLAYDPLQYEVIAVRKTMSGLLKLLFPDENVTQEEMAGLLDYAIEGRRRVKEQLKIMAGVEFSDVNLGYLDVTGAENVISVPEQSAETLVPAGTLPAGHVYAVGECQDDDDIAVYRLENKAVRGAGRFETQGIGLNRPLRESMNAAWQYFQNNAKRVMPGVLLADRDYLLYYDSVQGKGPSLEVSLAEWVGLCSALLDKPVVDSLAIVGEIRLSGSMGEVHNLESIVRVAKNAGARRLLLPAECMKDLMCVSGELLSAVQPIFYMNPVDAARKAMDIY